MFLDNIIATIAKSENIITSIAISRLIIEDVIKRPVVFSEGNMLTSNKTTTIMKNAAIKFFMSIKIIKP